MDNEYKLHTLAEIARALNAEKITGAVGASLLLYFKGIVPEFHDIDIMVAEPDAERAKAALCRIGSLAPQRGEPQYKTRWFLEYTVNGVDVDMMAGFVIVRDGVDCECPLLAEDMGDTTVVDGETVPLHSLSAWRRNYALMGRTAKAEMIDKYLSENP